jgi:hypothetical protein
MSSEEKLVVGFVSHQWRNEVKNADRESHTVMDVQNNDQRQYVLTISAADPGINMSSTNKPQNLKLV